MKKTENSGEEIYLAGGCLWGVQEFVRHLPGVIFTEAGRANGFSNSTQGPYDGYAECVRTIFDPTKVSVDPWLNIFLKSSIHGLNKQGPDIGKKYRTEFIVKIHCIFRKQRISFLQ